MKYYLFFILILSFYCLSDDISEHKDIRDGVVSIIDRNGNIVDEYVRFEYVNGLAVIEEDIVFNLAEIVPSNQENLLSIPNDYSPLGVYTSISGQKWPGNIPYAFSPAISGDKRNAIIQSMNQLSFIANINFIQRTNQNDYLYFELTDEDGICGRSYVGKQGGMQRVWLKESCVYVDSRTITHEILHALGFWHEHTRPDRDNYVNVHWDNIPSNYQHNFNKLTVNVAVSGSYDYSSIMHYFPSAWGNIVLSAKSATAPALGGYTLSDKDINALIEMYGERPRNPYVSRAGIEWVGCSTGGIARGFITWERLNSNVTYELQMKQGLEWYFMYTGTLSQFTFRAQVGSTVFLRVRAVDGQNQGAWFNFSHYVPCRGNH